jgi:beta-glucosidase
MVKYLTCFLLAVLSSATGHAQSVLRRDDGVERRIDSLLRLMTVEEKLGQLNQVGPQWEVRKEPPETNYQAELVRRGKIGSFLYLTGAEVTKRIQRIAVEESRLKIPLIFGLDVIHGFKTTFPIPLAMACTWNPELVEKAARVAAIEATAAGIHWTFAPMVDIARDPRWGRIAEGAGEDPFLGSVMAAAHVRGFQGADLRLSNTLLACAKHFAAYGGAEAGKDYNTVDLSERTIRDIYLPPFKAAVDAGVGTLMSAFNDIGGVPASGNRWLLTDVLRGEWKFNGFVVSDFAAVEQLIPHGIASSREHAGILGLTAGVDMCMVDTIYANELVTAVNAGKIPMSLVDESVRRVLRVKMALGLFDNPYRNCDSTLATQVHLKREHRELARQIARQSIVLLKNDQKLLPLKKDLKTLAVLGPLADERKEPRGPWSDGEAVCVSVLEGIKSTVRRRTNVLFAKGCEVEDDTNYNLAQALKLARRADAVVLVVGERADMSGEAASRANLDLPGKQKELVKAIIGTGNPVVLVLMNGRPLTLSWEAEHATAIIEAWFLGTEAGNAIADILFGDVNPSGKLTATFPRAVGQIPIYYNYKNTGRPIREKDKFTSKYLDVPNTPLFPFGYGLSYTTFAYSNVRLSSAAVSMGEDVTVSVDVANTGTRSGDEVVQLYLRDEVGSVTRPVKELKGFQRVSLNAGERKTVEFVLKPEHRSFWNVNMKYSEEPGWITVLVGGNSETTYHTRFEVK